MSFFSALRRRRGYVRPSAPEAPAPMPEPEPPATAQAVDTAGASDAEEDDEWQWQLALARARAEAEGACEPETAAQQPAQGAPPAQPPRSAPSAIPAAAPRRRFARGSNALKTDGAPSRSAAERALAAARASVSAPKIASPATPARRSSAMSRPPGVPQTGNS